MAAPCLHFFGLRGLGEEAEELGDVDVVGDKFFNHGDFVGVGGLGLDREIVDLGGDGEAFAAGDNDRDISLGEEFAEFRVRLNIIGEDDTGDVAVGGELGAGDGGEDNVVAVAGGDNEGAGLEVLDDAFGGHSADYDAGDALFGAAAAGVDPASADLLGDLGEVGGGEQLLHGQDAEEGHAEAGEAFAGVFSDHGDFGGFDFVEDGAEDLNAVLIEEGFVKCDLVDGTADAAGADQDDGGVEEFGNAGVGEVEDAAHAGVAGALDEGEVFFPRNAVEGAADAVFELGEHGVGVFDEAARESGVHRDGAHAFDGHADFIDGVEEDGVFVDHVAGDLDEALADGFDEADAGEVLLKGGEEAEAGGSLAVVHARGGDEDAAGVDVGGAPQEREYRQGKGVGGGGPGEEIRLFHKEGVDRWLGRRRRRRRRRCRGRWSRGGSRRRAWRGR